jgi:hypothetical protein
MENTFFIQAQRKPEYLNDATGICKKFVKKCRCLIKMPVCNSWAQQNLVSFSICKKIKSKCFQTLAFL